MNGIRKAVLKRTGPSGLGSAAWWPVPIPAGVAAL